MKSLLTLTFSTILLAACTTFQPNENSFISPDKRHEVVIDDTSVLLVVGVKAIGLVKDRESVDSVTKHIASVDKEAIVKVRWLSNEEILIECKELINEPTKSVEGITIRFG